jgi:hypothetical protein
MSAQTAPYDPEVSPAEFADRIILKPAEVEAVWNSEDPKHLMADFVARNVREKGSEWNRYSAFENRWEQAEFSIIGEYCLQALVFARGELKIRDLYTVGALTNAFFDLLMAFNNQNPGSIKLNERRVVLQEVLK